MYGLGYQQGNSVPDDALVILAFGRPKYNETDQYGTRLPGGDPFVKISDVKTAALTYLAGYSDASADTPAKHITLAIGTNNCINSVIYVKDAVEMQDCPPQTPAIDMGRHGREWADMVDEANAYLPSIGLGSRAQVWGGIDIEPDWSAPGETVPWVENFHINTTSFYINFGSADGCPPDPGPPRGVQ
jgi:hypothetical protein